MNLRQFLLVVLFFLASSCRDEHPRIPEVYVNFPIYPNDVSYLDLNYIGGHMYLTGGVNGIVVYRIDQWSFSAFDRACPHDWDDADEPRVSVENGITLKCPKCGSLYSILDGNVILGPSKYILKQYYTEYDGWSLRVHN